MTLHISGRTVVITRALPQSAEFVNALQQFGAMVLSCPTIEIKAPESYERLDEAIDHLYGYDWVIFTSTNAVDFFLRRLTFLNHHISDLDDLQVCAIGDASADKLRDARVHVDLIPQEAKAEGEIGRASCRERVESLVVGVS